ncbi:hypothetical protein ACWGHM_38095 [Streptomyces sp. NPDC054904]|uniref:hypothetical protein n=1 Tax=unclassified Streptomyces TaxID=2593676 RepID=UPI002481BD46|nr:MULTISPECIES: hypothetical protein [unclassified Streptomyces]MDA5281603.1 hypothetical protein [Streptomyces sp. Isolate_45]MDX2395570.1 hypothetical protein [Streptomyces sp. DK15]
MSPIAVGGPALFIGTDTPCVALVRPEIDPAQPGVREAAERAGVTPEEFAGPSDLWQLIADRTDGEGREIALNELSTADADAFAGSLLAATADPDAEFTVVLTVAAHDVLRLSGRPAGEGFAFLASVVPPPSEGTPPLEIEIGPTALADLRVELEQFRRSLG